MSKSSNILNGVQDLDGWGELDWMDEAYEALDEQNDYDIDDFWGHPKYSEDDDFGFFDTSSVKKVKLKKRNKNYCENPSNHIFKKKLLLTNNYLECEKCGYSPDLDKNKKEYEQCHNEYLQWKNTKK
jgi:hypothetical protein